MRPTVDSDRAACAADVISVLPALNTVAAVGMVFSELVAYVIILATRSAGCGRRVVRFRSDRGHSPDPAALVAPPRGGRGTCGSGRAVRV